MKENRISIVKRKQIEYVKDIECQKKIQSFFMRNIIKI